MTSRVGPDDDRNRLSATVMIASLHRPAELRRALAALAEQKRAPDEVVVVVRSDDTETMAVTQEPCDLPLRSVLVHRPGIIAARSAGLDAATGDIVAFLDDDAVPPPDWLGRMLAHYDDPSVGAVGGRDELFHDGVPADEGPSRDVGILTWYGRLVGLHHRGFGEPRDVDFLKGVNMSFHRARFPDVRVPDTLRGRGIQEYDEWILTLMVKRRGARVVYDPSITVEHFEADRHTSDPRKPHDFRRLYNRAHNHTFVVARYYPPYRTVIHLLFYLLVGTRSDAPGLAATVYNLLRDRRFDRNLTALAATVLGRPAGVITAVADARRARSSS